MAESKGVAIAAGTAGSILLYSAVTGKGILATIRNVVAGKKPSGVTNAVQGETPAFPAGTGPSGGIFGSIGNVAGDAAAADALKYKGAGYVWGGAPAIGIGNWDCSSFANWVYGHDMRLPIPGYAAGTYTGEAHGPPTEVWLLWGGLTSIGHDGEQAQPGDVCVWQTHMGIAIGGGEMISAENPTDGTQIGTIGSGVTGFIPGELLFVRRYGG